MLPTKILNRIQQNEALVIRWAGHRDIYEIVEEWIDSLFWLGNLWLTAYYLGFLGRKEIGIWVSLFMLSLFCLMWAIYETYRWTSEWHVLTQDTNKGNGVYFKADGIIGLQMVPLDISKVIPETNEFKNNPIYWFWRKTTGHRLEKITLKSDAGIFLLRDSRMPPSFMDTWYQLRGPIAMTKPEDGIWHDVEHLTRLMTRGLFNFDEGKHIIWELVNRRFYG